MKVDLKGVVVRPDFTGKKSRRHLPDRKAPLVIDHEGAHCGHEFLALVRLARVVVCRNPKCNQQLDAFEVLVRLARRWDTATWLETEIGERKARVEFLKAEEKKLKARIRRSGGEVPDPHTLALVAIKSSSQ